MFQLLSILTLAGGILLIALIALVLLARFNRSPFLAREMGLIERYALAAALVVALAATLGSLYISEIAGLIPCELCWFQRIFMYPQVAIIALALITRDRGAAKYIIALSLIGAAFAAYHYYIQLNPPPVDYCGIDSGESCSARPFLYYGYITIPMMALTAFLLNIVLAWLGREKRLPSREGD